MKISSRHMSGISASTCFERNQDMIQQWDWVICYVITYSPQVLSKFSTLAIINGSGCQSKSHAFRWPRGGQSKVTIPLSLSWFRAANSQPKVSPWDCAPIWGFLCRKHLWHVQALQPVTCGIMQHYLFHKYYGCTLNLEINKIWQIILL